jgi:hypothetical protein
MAVRRVPLPFIAPALKWTGVTQMKRARSQET